MKNNSIVYDNFNKQSPMRINNNESIVEDNFIKEKEENVQTQIQYVENGIVEKGTMNTEMASIITTGLNPVVHNEMAKYQLSDIPRKKVRYIRDWLGGNDKDANGHWCEIEVRRKSDNVNIALGKKVTQVGTETVYPLLTDGNRATTSYISMTGGGGIELDLGEEYYINDLIVNVLHFYKDARTFNNTKVEFSTDKVEWTALRSGVVHGLYVEEAKGMDIDYEVIQKGFNIKKDFVGARYIREYVNGNSNTTTSEITEIEVIEKYTLENIARNKPVKIVIGPEIPSTLSPSTITDGILDSSGYYTVDGPLCAEVDLGEIVNINDYIVRVFHNKVPARKYKDVRTFFSEDGINWTLIRASSIVGEVPEGQHGIVMDYYNDVYLKSLEEPIIEGIDTKKVRYIRDHLNGSSSSAYSNWNEIRVIDKKTGENVALNKEVTLVYGEKTSGAYPLSTVTNGEHILANHVATHKEGCIQVDLGEAYDAKDLIFNVIHYYDKRIYKGIKTEVSEDGIEWVTIRNGDIDAPYQATEDAPQNTFVYSLNYTANARPLVEARYIREYINGSNLDVASHMVELMVINRITGENIALGKPVTAETPEPRDFAPSPIEIITNGNLATAEHSGTGGPLTITVDLEETINMNDHIVRIYHYYGDGRTYKELKSEFSADGENWTMLRSNERDGSYPETSAGKTTDYYTEVYLSEQQIPTITEEIKSNNKIRYLRDYVNGNNVDKNSHWSGIELFYNENIIDKKLTLIEGTLSVNSGTMEDLSNNNLEKYIEVEGPACLEVDLLQDCNLEDISLNILHLANRMYNHRIEVSLDGLKWIALKDTRFSGAMLEKESDFTEKLFARYGEQVRYVRDSANGNSNNAGSHWLEIEVTRKTTGEVVSLNKPVSVPFGNHHAGLLTWVTNGDSRLSNDYASTTGHGTMQVDLERTYHLSDLIIRPVHYTDGRTYYGTKTEVSKDGINWITIRDSAVDGVYKEDGSMSIDYYPDDSGTLGEGPVGRYNLIEWSENGINKPLSIYEKNIITPINKNKESSSSLLINSSGTLILDFEAEKNAMEILNYKEVDILVADKDNGFEVNDVSTQVYENRQHDLDINNSLNAFTFNVRNKLLIEIGDTELNDASMTSLNLELQPMAYIKFYLGLEGKVIKSATGLPPGLAAKEDYIEGSPVISGDYKPKLLFEDGTTLKGKIKVHVIDRII